MMDKLRVAMIAGELGQSGAEKQLFYISQALVTAGAEIRVYSLNQGEYFESLLSEAGVRVEWVGQNSQPLLRMSRIFQKTLTFRPHIVYSTHFYTNLYAAIVSRLTGTLSIGSIRSDGHHEVVSNGGWGMALLKSPHVLVANSTNATRNAAKKGVELNRIFFLPNVIDLIDFDERANAIHQPDREHKSIIVVTVARLIKAKRLDRFISAVAAARLVFPELKGIIAGEGPLREKLTSQACDLGLLPEGLSFLGYCKDVPALLKNADIFMLTSDYEGFPNAILEAMAAGLPVITTRAGEAPRVVADGENGLVVSFEDSQELNLSLIRLAGSKLLRQAMGHAGRRMVEEQYSNVQMSRTLIHLFKEIAQSRQDRHLVDLLDAFTKSETRDQNVEEAVLG